MSSLRSRSIGTACLLDAGRIFSIPFCNPVAALPTTPLRRHHMHQVREEGHARAMPLDGCRDSMLVQQEEGQTILGQIRCIGCEVSPTPVVGPSAGGSANQLRAMTQRRTERTGAPQGEGRSRAQHWRPAHVDFCCANEERARHALH